MANVTTLSAKNDFDQINNLSFGFGQRKMYRNDPMYAFYNIQCHAGDDSGTPTNAKLMQLVVSNTELPIAYAGNNTILVRLKRDSQLMQILCGIEAKVKAAAPPGVSVESLVKDNGDYEPSFKMKTEWTALHEKSTGALEQGCVLKRCLFCVGRLNHYQGRYHWGLILKSALVSDTPSEPYDTHAAMAQENLAMLDD